MFVTFGELTKKSLLFIAVPLIMIIRRIFTYTVPDKSKNMFYSHFIKFSGHSLSGILWLLIERATTSNKEKKKEFKNDKLLNDKNKKNNMQDGLYDAKKRKMEIKNKIKKICILMSACIINFIAFTCYIILLESKYYSDRTGGLVCLTITGRIFAIEIFSHIIIKNTKLYAHHYLSIIVILIIVLYSNIYSLTTEDNEHYFEKFGLMILPEVLFALSYVCATKYLIITNGNIYQYLCIDGITGLICLVLLQLITHYTVDCGSIKHFFNKNAPYCDQNDGTKLKTIIENFKFINVGVYIISIISIFVNFFEMWLIWLLIFNFSVNHFGAICSIPLFFICFITEDIGFKNYTVYLLGGFIIIFMTFVYNEILILRFNGFDKNTAVEIKKRSEIDIRGEFDEDNEEICIKNNENYLIVEDENEEMSDKGSDKNLELNNYYSRKI